MLLAELRKAPQDPGRDLGEGLWTGLAGWVGNCGAAEPPADPGPLPGGLVVDAHILGDVDKTITSYVPVVDRQPLFAAQSLTHRHTSRFEAGCRCIRE